MQCRAVIKLATPARGLASVESRWTTGGSQPWCRESAIDATRSDGNTCTWQPFGSRPCRQRPTTVCLTLLCTANLLSVLAPLPTLAPDRLSAA